MCGKRPCPPSREVASTLPRNFVSTLPRKCLHQLQKLNAGGEEVVSREEGKGGAAPQREKKGAVARTLSLVSHTCGHTGRARTVLDWVVLR